MSVTNLHGQVKTLGLGPVGRGGSATIWRGHWVYDPNGEQLAIKVALVQQGIPHHTLRNRLEHEIRIWNRLKHKNILELYGWIVDPDNDESVPQLVSPWCHHGSLLDFLQSMKHKLDRSLRCSIIRDFTDGLHYMHTAPTGPVMHGDIKSANILIAEGFVAKIADFGLSRTVPRPQNNQTMTVVGPGTLRWMTPEALHRHVNAEPPLRPTSATDIWAWGHLVYEILTGNIPYPQFPTEFAAVPAIIAGKHNPRPTEDDLNTDTFLTGLLWPTLENCWALDPEARPTITEIIHTTQFADISATHDDDALYLDEDPARFDSALQHRKQGEEAFNRGAFKEALDYYEKARDLFDGLGDIVRHASCLQDLGWTHTCLRDYDAARTCIMEARDTFRKVGDLKRQLDTIQDLAMTERATGNLVLAREYLESAFEGCRNAGLHVRSGWCLVAIGLLEVDVANWEAAHRCFNSAVAIAEKEGDTGLFARSKEHQGDCFIRQGQGFRAGARKCYDDAARAYRLLPNQEHQVQRVEEKIQKCYTVNANFIQAMPLWGIQDFQQFVAPVEGSSNPQPRPSDPARHTG